MTAGGLGFGNAPLAESRQEGGGAGGVLTARPVGFIELADDHAGFRPIITSGDVLRVLGFATASLMAARRWRRRRR